MPGGTLWGQAQLRIFDRKCLPALKITKLVFFLLISYVVVPRDFDTRVNLIYFRQFSSTFIETCLNIHAAASGLLT